MSSTRAEISWVLGLFCLQGVGRSQGYRECKSGKSSNPAFPAERFGIDVPCDCSTIPSALAQFPYYKTEITALALLTASTHGLQNSFIC